MPGTEGVEITGPAGDRYDEILTPEALGLHRRRCTASSAPGARELLAARDRRAGRAHRRRHPRLPAGDRERPRGPTWRVAPPAPGPGRPAGGDHRADRPQDDDQRAELRAPRSGWPTSRTPTRPHWDNVDRRPAQPARRAATARIDFTAPSGKTYALRRRRAGRRSWSGRAAGTWTRSTSLVDGEPVVRQPGRLRPVLLPQRAARSSSAGSGPVLLPAEDGEPPRGAAVERRLHPAPRTRSASRSGTIRATVLIETIPAAFEMEEILYELRDHVGRPERRPLGLPLQRHQEVPRRAAASSCCRTATRSR